MRPQFEVYVSGTGPGPYWSGIMNAMVVCDIKTPLCQKPAIVVAVLRHASDVENDLFSGFASSLLLIT